MSSASPAQSNYYYSAWNRQGAPLPPSRRDFMTVQPIHGRTAIDHFVVLPTGPQILALEPLRLAIDACQAKALATVKAVGTAASVVLLPASVLSLRVGGVGPIIAASLALAAALVYMTSQITAWAMSRDEFLLVSEAKQDTAQPLDVYSRELQSYWTMASSAALTVMCADYALIIAESLVGTVVVPDAVGYALLGTFAIGIAALALYVERRSELNSSWAPYNVGFGP